MLLNENRNRVPQVGQPITATTPGKRGDMMMVTEGSPVSNVLYVCLVSGEGADVSNVVWSSVDLTII